MTRLPIGPLSSSRQGLSPAEELSGLGVTSASQCNGDLKRWVDDTLGRWIWVDGGITRSLSRLSM